MTVLPDTQSALPATDDWLMLDRGSMKLHPDALSAVPAPEFRVRPKAEEVDSNKPMKHSKFWSSLLRIT